VKRSKKITEISQAGTRRIRKRPLSRLGTNEQLRKSSGAVQVRNRDKRSHDQVKNTQEGRGKKNGRPSRKKERTISVLQEKKHTEKDRDRRNTVPKPGSRRDDRNAWGWIRIQERGGRPENPPSGSKGSAFAKHSARDPGRRATLPGRNGEQINGRAREYLIGHIGRGAKKQNRIDHRSWAKPDMR